MQVGIVGETRRKCRIRLRECDRLVRTKNLMAIHSSVYVLKRKYVNPKMDIMHERRDRLLHRNAIPLTRQNKRDLSENSIHDNEVDARPEVQQRIESRPDP